VLRQIDYVLEENLLTPKEPFEEGEYPKEAVVRITASNTFDKKLTVI
jgi:hypothetical protein